MSKTGLKRIGFWLLNLMLLVGVVMRVYRYELAPEYVSVFMKGTWTDVFSHAKSVYIVSLVIFTLLIAVLYYFQSRETNLHPPREVVAVTGLLITLIALSTLFSKYPDIALSGGVDRFEGFYVWICYLLLPILVYVFSSNESDKLRLISNFAIISSAILSLAMFQYFGLDFFKMDWLKYILVPSNILKHVSGFSISATSAYGSLYNQNYVGGLATMVVPICIYLFASTRETSMKITYFVGMSVSTLAILGAHSTGGYFTLLLSIGFLLLMNNLKKHNWRNATNYAILSIVLIVAVTLFIDTEARKQLVIFEKSDANQEITSNGSTNSSDQNEASSELALLIQKATNVDMGLSAPYIGFEGHENFGSGRGYIWSRTLPLLKSVIFIGHGADTFPFYFPQNDKGKMLITTNYLLIFDKPHNMYLQIALSFGVVFLVIFTVFTIYLIVMLLRKFLVGENAVSLFLAIGLFSFGVIGLVNDTTVHVSLYFWLLVGLALVELFPRNENKRLKGYRS